MIRWFFFISALPIWSIPLSPVVMEGGADFRAGLNQLEIFCEDRSIIDWQSFSIDSEERVLFQFLDPDSVVLNRIFSTEPSYLMGRLDSNGKVILLNPNGVIIGKEGIIQTASFIGTAFSPHLEAFRAREKLQFNPSEVASSIVCEGKIICSGDLALIANEIEQRGFLHGRNVSCLAGAAHDLHIALTESVEPSRLQVSGTIRSEKDAILLGKEIVVEGSAKIDVSRIGGGGNIWIGGGYQGSDSRFSNSEFVQIQKGAELFADAHEIGDGGSIIIWGNLVNSFEGRISARGGPKEGNGGFVEVSSPHLLSYRGLSDLRAENGKFGMLFLDPTDVNISALPLSPGVIIGNPSVIPAVASVEINNTDLVNQLNLSDVFISTSTAGTAGGNIIVADPVGVMPNTPNWTAGTSLTLWADQDITVNESIIATMGSFIGNRITMIADANHTGVGNLLIQDTLQTTTIMANEGAIYLEGANITLSSNSFRVELNAIGANGGILAVARNNFNAVTGFANMASMGLLGVGVEIYAGRNILLQTNLGSNAHMDLFSTTQSITLIAGETMQIFGCIAPPFLGPNSYVHLSSGGDLNLIAGEDVIGNGNNVISDGGSGGQLAVELSTRNDDATTRVYALGDIHFNSGTHFDNGVFLTSSFIFGSPATYGNVDLRASGDILLCTSIDRVGAIFSNPNTNPNNYISILADHLFATGEAWGALPYAALATTPLGTASGNISTVSGEVGGNISGAFGVQNSFLMEGSNVPSGIYMYTIDGDITIKTSDRFTSFAQANFLIGNQPTILGGLRAVDIQSSTGNITVDPFFNITIDNVTATAGNVLEIAQNDIYFTSTGGISAGGDVVLVCDNQFPNPPFFGPGSFTMDAGSSITSGGLLQIYTSMQGINIPLLGSLNGASFNPGTLFVDTNQEIWCTYYPTFIPGSPFTISYKDCIQTLLEQATEIADEFLVDLHPYNEFPGWMERFTTTCRDFEGAEDIFYIRRRNLNVVNHPKSYTTILLCD